MQEIITSKKFEQTSYCRHEHEQAEHIAATALQLGRVAMDFARVERVPRYSDGERENDVEHSFMLALVAPELAAALELPLDHGKVSQYAIVHDLVEIKTGDVATFSISEADLAQKHRVEEEALRHLYLELPPHTASILYQYESQQDPEARFVKFIDKLLPLVVDIIGNGEQVMHEDYNVQSLQKLHECHEELSMRWQAKFGEEFPEIYLAHQVLAELFELKFSNSNLS